MSEEITCLNILPRGVEHGEISVVMALSECTPLP